MMSNAVLKDLVSASRTVSCDKSELKAHRMLRLFAFYILATAATAAPAPAVHKIEVRTVVFREWLTTTAGASGSATLGSNVRGLSVRFYSIPPVSQRISMGLALTVGTRHGDPNRIIYRYPDGETDLPMHIAFGLPILIRYKVFEFGIQPMLSSGPYELGSLNGSICCEDPAVAKPTPYYDDKRLDYIHALGVEFEGGVSLSTNVMVHAMYRITPLLRTRGLSDKKLAHGIGMSVGYRTDSFKPSGTRLDLKGRLVIRTSVIMESFPETRINRESLLGSSTALTLTEVAYLIPVDRHLSIGVSGVVGVRASDPNGDYSENTSIFTYGVGLPVAIDMGWVAIGIQPSITQGPYRVVRVSGSTGPYSGHSNERFADGSALNVSLFVGANITDHISLGAVYRITPVSEKYSKEYRRRVEGYGISIAYRFVR
jgi:hypothetical protein